MQFKQINWFALVGGILLLVLLGVSIYFPWWQLIVGENLLSVNASPVNTVFSLLGNQFSSPVIWIMNLTGILTFLTSAIILLIYSVIPNKSYSKDLLSFAYRKPLYVVVLYVVGLLVATFAIKAALGVDLPLAGTTTISLPSSLTMGINVSVNIFVAFQWPFWLGIVVAGLCIAARIYHSKLSSTPNQIPQTTINPQPTLATKPRKHTIATKTRKKSRVKNPSLTSTR